MRLPTTFSSALELNVRSRLYRDAADEGASLLNRKVSQLDSSQVRYAKTV